jgi:hypothetical protein
MTQTAKKCRESDMKTAVACLNTGRMLGDSTFEEGSIFNTQQVKDKMNVSGILRRVRGKGTLKLMLRRMETVFKPGSTDEQFDNK